MGELSWLYILESWFCQARFVTIVSLFDDLYFLWETLMQNESVLSVTERFQFSA